MNAIFLKMYYLYKICINFVIFYPNIIFFNYININISKKEYIEIDNEFESYLRVNEIPFYHNKTQLKPIALYVSEFNNVSYFKIIQLF